ncbi:MAG: S8 family serine peptidase, partial [Thermoplasmata archaeon]|nr:S8 family serine peptidase [Thermoplasmata archaeon]
MMKIKIAALFVTLILSLQIGSLMVSGEESEEPPLAYGEEKEFMHWIRDRNHNGIDDLLDSKLDKNPGQYVDLYVDYDHYPTSKDRERVSRYLNIYYAPKYINTLCAQDVPIRNVRDIAALPGVVMVEEQLPLKTMLDISNRAIKARQSDVYADENEWGQYTYKGYGITVAVLDTGVDDAHPTFGPQDNKRYLGGYDATKAIETNPTDNDGHGTHVAGIILGQGGGDDDPDNNFTGVAPDAKLIDVKVQESTSAFASADFIRGVDWCIEQHDNRREWHEEQGAYNGIDILSVSLGDNSNDDGQSATARAVNRAVSHGLIVVCAAGNNGENRINAPGSADRVITVGAIDDNVTIDREDDLIWDGSNYGPRRDDGDDDHLDELKPDVVAPGVNIMSASNNYEIGADYTEMTGTSQATPHVAGVCALMLQSKTNLRPDNGTKNIKLIIRRTSEMPDGIKASQPAIDNKWNASYGCGLLDAYKAVWYAVTSAEVEVSAINFEDNEPNEGESIWIEVRVTETKGIDVGGGVVKIYKDSIGDGNKILEEDLNGLVDGGSKTYNIYNHRVKGGDNKIIVKVTDMDGAGDVEDEKTVYANYRPTAELHTDGRKRIEYNVDPEQKIHFHGNASEDPEHDNITFKFDMDDGTVLGYSDTSWIGHAFENGRYRVSLRVKDEHGAESIPDEVVITANLDPTADAGDDIVKGKGDEVEFQGTAFNDGDHDDPNDEIVLYEWDFENDGVYEFEDDKSGYATHTYNELGDDYVARFRVTDKWGAQAEDEVNVEIVEGKPPEVDAGEDKVALVGKEVDFHGTASDEDGNITKYEWNFEGNTEWREYENGEASHTYKSHGEYSAKFRVTDNDGNGVIDSCQVRVHRFPEAKIASPKDGNTYNSDTAIDFDA